MVAEPLSDPASDYIARIQAQPADIIGRPWFALMRHERSYRNGVVRSITMPRQPDGAVAKCDDPSTLHSLDDVLDAYRRDPDQYVGVARALFKHDQLTVIDLDGCRFPQATPHGVDGGIVGVAHEILKTFSTYAEVSRSGAGVHIWARGNLPGRGINKKFPERPFGREMYDTSKFITVTGRFVQGYLPRLAYRPHEIADLYTELGGVPQDQGPAQIIVPPQALMADDVAWQHLSRATRALMDGHSPAEKFFASRSEQRFSLVEHLAYDLGGQRDQILRFVRKSKLWGTDWERRYKGSTTKIEHDIDKMLRSNYWRVDTRRERNQPPPDPHTLATGLDIDLKLVDVLLRHPRVNREAPVLLAFLRLWHERHDADGWAFVYWDDVRRLTGTPRRTAIRYRDALADAGLLFKGLSTDMIVTDDIGHGQPDRTMLVKFPRTADETIRRCLAWADTRSWTRN